MTSYRAEQSHLAAPAFSGGVGINDSQRSVPSCLSHSVLSLVILRTSPCETEKGVCREIILILF